MEYWNKPEKHVENYVLQFNGKNFVSWQLSGQLLLMQKSLWGVVFGEEKEPKTKTEAVA